MFSNDGSIYICDVNWEWANACRCFQPNEFYCFRAYFRWQSDEPLHLSFCTHFSLIAYHIYASLCMIEKNTATKSMSQIGARVERLTVSCIRSATIRRVQLYRNRHSYWILWLCEKDRRSERERACMNLFCSHSVEIIPLGRFITFICDIVGVLFSHRKTQPFDIISALFNWYPYAATRISHWLTL